MFALPAAGLAAAGTLAYLGRPKPIAVQSASAAPDPDTWSQYPSDRDCFWNVNEDAEMPIYLAKKGAAALNPISIVELMGKSVAKSPNGVAMKVEEKNATGDLVWVDITWLEYQKRIMQVARSFLHLGLPRFGSICLIGFNRPEWLVAYMGAIWCGAKGVGIYSSNSPESAGYIAAHCKAKLIVVEDWSQLEKFVSVLKQIPECSAFVVYKSISAEKLAEANKHKPTYTWAEFLKIGEGKADLEELLQSRLSQIRPGHVCSLIYTSGTTGPPKATMCRFGWSAVDSTLKEKFRSVVTHDAVLFMTRKVVDVLPESFHHEERLVSYLPLSHIAAQLIDCSFKGNILNCVFVLSGVQVRYLATIPNSGLDRSPGSLQLTMLAAQPTIFFEKFAEKFQSTESKATGLQKHLIEWAKSVGVQRFRNGSVNGSHYTPWFENVAERLVLSQVRAKIGLNSCRLFATGAAPIHVDTLEYLAGFGIRLHELYGMSECSGACTFNYLDSYLPGSVGKALPGCEVKLQHVPGRDNPGEGELCLRGRNVMAGYMSDPEKTKEVIDSEGFLHSGDVGRLDEYGFYHIVGRIKELIITYSFQKHASFVYKHELRAGGENIAPVPIESALKIECSGLSNVVMIGDKRKYNVMLVTLKSNIGSDGIPTQELVGEALSVSPNVKAIKDALHDSAWKKYISDGISSVNAKAVSNASKVQKFRILPVDFSVPGGELTPSLKICRPVVTQKYKDIIEQMYNE